MNLGFLIFIGGWAAVFLGTGLIYAIEASYAFAVAMKISTYCASAIHDAVFITDLDGKVSVTNDAERVVAEMLRIHPQRRIFYRDSTGQWDELKHDGKKFVNFAPMDAIDKERYKDYLA